MSTEIKDQETYLEELENILPDLKDIRFSHNKTDGPRGEEHSMMEILQRAVKITDRTGDEGENFNADMNVTFELKNKGLFLGADETVSLAVGYGEGNTPRMLSLTFNHPQSHRKAVLQWGLEGDETESLICRAKNTQFGRGIETYLDFEDGCLNVGTLDNTSQGSIPFLNESALSEGLKIADNFQAEAGGMTEYRYEYNHEQGVLAFNIMGLRGRNAITELHLPRQMRIISPRR